MAERYYIATERNTQHWRCVRCRGFRGEISKKKCKSQNQKAAAGEGHAGGGGRGERAAGRGVSGTSADAAQDLAPVLKTGIGPTPSAGVMHQPEVLGAERPNFAIFSDFWVCF